MKKIIKTAMAALTACMAAVVMAVTVSAEVKDVELSVVRAKMAPAWGQSITYTGDEFGITNLTEDSEILIEYETEEGLMPDNGYHPVEVILQNYVVDPQIWAQIAPTEFDETTAKFAYAELVEFYADYGGAEDLTDVNNVCLGATLVGAKVTKVTITNVDVPEVTTTTTEAVTEATTEATTTEAVTEAITEATTAATTAAPAAEKESGGIPIVLIVVITVVVAVAVVVTIIVIKSKRRFY